MKVELGVFERLWLLNNAVPNRSSAHNLRIAQELIGILGISAEERETLNFRDEKDEDGGTRVVWDQPKEAKKIVLSDAQVKLLSESLRTLDEKEELPMQLLSLYDKFVGEE